MVREGDVTVPRLLQEGTPMTKVSSKKRRSSVFRLDPNIGQIIWEGKQQRIIPIENIKELRSGSDARYYREQFQLAAEYEDRWLTIVYIIDGTYKTLHLIAASCDVFKMWDTTLRRLHAIRKELMSGLGNFEMRQALWEKHYWKGADEEQDQKLMFDEVEKLCRRLNINSSSNELQRLFKQADVHQRNYLDFEDFRRFVKFLKGRPEIDRLYNKLCARSGSMFDFAVFERFMREKQQSGLSTTELQNVFERYSELVEDTSTSTSTSASASTSASPTSPTRIMSKDAFTSFLMSTDNAAFTDQHGRVYHDMTRPLSDYYVSSSHNTYLVGHQLVGVSTIEGYIRALLHSCRSVELDIFDGDTPSEPQITHGKTFTSKVSLREVCHAIMKYGFVASPYPIIISAEIHCSLAGQDAIADIMCEVFGEKLVQSPISHEERLDRLPSPEELKGRILLKAKNLYLVRRKESYAGGGMSENEYGLTETSASASSSTSDSDAVFEKQVGKPAIKRKEETSAVKEFKDDLMKAGSTVFQRVKSVGKSSSRSNSGSNSITPQRVPSASLPLTTATGTPSSYLPSRGLTISPGSMYSPSPSSNFTSLPSASFLSTSPTATSPLSSPLNGSGAIPIPASPSSTSKPKMSARLLSLLVYTVGVKYRGINKKEIYAPEHMFSLSETTANRMLKSNTGGMQDIIKHCRTHLVRIYPKGMRVDSSNYEPHRYWSAGTQLVAINWQTFDLGYMLNHAMFQRNGRAGPPLQKDLLFKHTKHHFDVSIISAQQLPRPKDSSGREIVDKNLVDPFVEVSIHVPDWPSTTGMGTLPTTPTPSRAHTYRTGVVKGNGFNPVWEEKLRIPFECVGDMQDLVFVRFVVRANEKEDVEPLAVYCASLGSLGAGKSSSPLYQFAR
ncbi:1-phosphatidylinositol-4,5-bisphosphate phosphodiesterase 1 [Termitomyces sp. J132]|nr:1-phosphatidylinositol-4,5-bisphosphate phosphodiesterase 1 [Termitomyces sp. J132]